MTTNGTDARAKDDIISEVCEHLAKGRALLVACGLSKVSRRTFYNWLSEEVVSVQVEEARARGAEVHRKRLERSLRAGDSRGANVRLNMMATLYEAYQPPKVRQEVSGPDGKAQQVEMSGAVSIDLSGAVRIARGESK